MKSFKSYDFWKIELFDKIDQKKNEQNFQKFKMDTFNCRRGLKPTLKTALIFQLSDSEKKFERVDRFKLR